MLAYRCWRCGRLKFPDGAGCECGEAWATLQVVEVDTGELIREVTGGRLCRGDIEVEDFQGIVGSVSCQAAGGVGRCGPAGGICA